MIIYKVTNRVNGKIYIGQTAQTLKQRQTAHLFACSQYVFHKAIRKYGAENFIFEKLCDCSSKEEMNRKEIEIIKEMNSKVPIGYNLTDGGSGMCGFKHSQESKTKMSATVKGRKFTEEHKAKIGLANTGRKCSDLVLENFRVANIGRVYTEERRARIGAARKGQKHSEETKEKIRVALMGNTNTLGLKYKRHKKAA